MESANFKVRDDEDVKHYYKSQKMPADAEKEPKSNHQSKTKTGKNAKAASPINFIFRAQEGD